MQPLFLVHKIRLHWLKVNEKLLSHKIHPTFKVIFAQNSASYICVPVITESLKASGPSFLCNCVFGTVYSLWGSPLKQVVVLVTSATKRTKVFIVCQGKTSKLRRKLFFILVGRCSERLQKGYQLDTILHWSIALGSYFSINMPWHKFRPAGGAAAGAVRRAALGVHRG